MSVDLVCINPALVHKYWSVAEPHIEAATEIGDWTVSEIREGLLTGRMLLWFPVEDGLVLGSVITGLGETRPGLKVCTIIACGGDDFAKWRHLIAVIEQYAKKENCAVVRISGRVGWKRMFPDYAEPFVIIEKKMD